MMRDASGGGNLVWRRGSKGLRLWLRLWRWMLTVGASVLDGQVVAAWRTVITRLATRRPGHDGSLSAQ
jgi:hypothetical protein